MRHLKTITLLFLVSITALVFPCDECSSFDYSNIQGKNYFGIYYRYREYNGYTSLDHTPQFNLGQASYQNAKIAHVPIEEDEYIFSPTRYDYEIFKTVELRYSHTFKDIINVMVILPYHVNHLYFKEIYPIVGQKFDSLSTNKGIGDITLSVTKILDKERKALSHRFVYGIGLTAPTGKFSLLNNENQLVDPDHQVGKGAWDFIFRLNYNLTINKNFGVRTFMNYAISRAQEYDGARTISYRQGDRFNAKLDIYYPLGNMQFKFSPAVGMYFENSQADRFNSKEWEDTGGSILFLTVMPELKFKELYFRPQYFLPIYQVLNGEQLQNSGRISLAIIYSF